MWEQPSPFDWKTKARDINIYQDFIFKDTLHEDLGLVYNVTPRQIYRIIKKVRQSLMEWAKAREVSSPASGSET